LHSPVVQDCAVVAPRFPRLAPSLVAFAAAWLATGTASAQTGGTSGTPTASAITADDIFIGVQDVENANLSDFNVNRFFNKARCDCDEDVFVFVSLKPSGIAKRANAVRTGALELWVGPNCDQITFRLSQCKQLANPTWAEFLNLGKRNFQTNARIISTYTNAGAGSVDGGTTSFVFPPNGTPDCTAPIESFNQTIWVLVSITSVGTYDIVAKRLVPVRLTPPAAPEMTQENVQPADQALIVSWPKINTALFPNILGYQVLCNRAGSLQVFANGTFAPGFHSARSVCPDKPDRFPTAGGVEGLDPLFACSPLLTATNDSYRVKILQDGIPYGVAVVTVDTSGNPSVPDVFYESPVRTKSFYDLYRDGNTGNNGDATPGGDAGGFCNLAPEATRPRWGMLGIVAVALAAIVIARRRRRR
jgi:hypothetical protein